MAYDFKTKLAYSKGVQQDSDIETLKRLLVGTVSVVKTPPEIDKTGVDYIATLRGGAQVKIDAKTRERGCAQFWTQGPELAPEIWSVRPGGKYRIPEEQAKTGWTLDESKEVDYIYCSFDPIDTTECYLLPFQLYRIAFRRHFVRWLSTYRHAVQDSGSWESECLFVPANIIITAIDQEMVDEVETEKQGALF